MGFKGVTGYIWLRICSSGGFFEHGSEHSAAIKSVDLFTSWATVSFQERTCTNELEILLVTYLVIGSKLLNTYDFSSSHDVL